MRDLRVGRQRIVEALIEGLPRQDWVRAAWFGGSDATGRTDALSDVDLQLIVEDDRVEDAIALVTLILESLSPIEVRYRVPEPAWHGHSQEFFRLRDADPCHMVDLLVIRKSAPERFLERERHGDAVAILDREGLLAAPPFDRAGHRRRMDRRLNELRARFALFEHLVPKAVLRGHGALAAQRYWAFSLAPLVELLRMRYCPERFDYGLNYLDRDLPSEWRLEVERLAFADGPETLVRLHREAAAHTAGLLAAYDRGEWSLSL